MRVSGKQAADRVARLAHDLLQRLLFFRVDDAVQDVDQRGGGHVSKRVPVRDGGDFRPLPIQLLYGYVILSQPQRSDAHDAAAAFAVVLRLVDVTAQRAVRVLFLLRERGQAGVAGRSEAVQLRDLQQPGDAAGGASLREGCLLCKQPVLIGSADIAVGSAANAARGHVRFAVKDAVGREQRHLRIIGDERFPTDGIQFVFLYAVVPVTGKQRAFIEKFDRIAECVARRAADQAAADPVQMHLRFLNPFRRGGSIAVHKRLLTFFFCFTVFVFKFLHHRQLAVC